MLIHKIEIPIAADLLTLLCLQPGLRWLHHVGLLVLHTLPCCAPLVSAPRTRDTQ